MVEIREHLSAIERDLDAAIGPAVSSPLQDVPTVGWNCLSVLGHMAQNLAHWANVIGNRSDLVEDPPPLTRDLAGWLVDFETWVRRSGDGFVEAVDTALQDDTAGPAMPPIEDVAIRARILANETAIHRWDLENAVGSAPPIDADAAADYLDLLVTNILPTWILARRPVETFEPGIRLAPTDTTAQICVAIRHGQITTASDPNVTATATTSELLLWSYGRIRDVPTDGSVKDAGRWVEICRFA